MFFKITKRLSERAWVKSTIIREEHKSLDSGDICTRDSAEQGSLSGGSSIDPYPSSSIFGGGRHSFRILFLAFG